MPDRREWLGIAGVGLAAAAVGLLFSPRLGKDDQGPQALRAARFTDLTGATRTLAEWKGQVLVLNFWATWCPPCREEIPALVRARDKLHASGAEFVGIAIDNAAKVAAFAEEVRISYPLLLADAGGLELLRTLGNPSGGLPFTVLVDRKGEVADRHLGLLTQQAIESKLRPLLTQSG